MRPGTYSRPAEPIPLTSPRLAPFLVTHVFPFGPSMTCGIRSRMSAVARVTKRSVGSQHRSRWQSAEIISYRMGSSGARIITWGAPKWPPTPPNARRAPAKPWRTSGLGPHTPQRSARPGEAEAHLEHGILHSAPVAAAVETNDATEAGGLEVAGGHEDLLALESVDEGAARLAREVRIHVRSRDPVRLLDLHRTVVGVAQDERAVAARCDQDAHVPR